MRGTLKNEAQALAHRCFHGHNLAGSRPQQGMREGPLETKFHLFCFKGIPRPKTLCHSQLITSKQCFPYIVHPIRGRGKVVPYCSPGNFHGSHYTSCENQHRCSAHLCRAEFVIDLSPNVQPCVFHAGFMIDQFPWNWLLMGAWGGGRWGGASPYKPLLRPRLGSLPLPSLPSSPHQLWKLEF